MIGHIDFNMISLVEIASGNWMQEGAHGTPLTDSVEILRSAAMEHFLLYTQMMYLAQQIENDPVESLMDIEGSFVRITGSKELIQAAIDEGVCQHPENGEYNPWWEVP